MFRMWINPLLDIPAIRLTDYLINRAGGWLSAKISIMLKDTLSVVVVLVWCSNLI